MVKQLLDPSEVPDRSHVLKVHSDALVAVADTVRLSLLTLDVDFGRFRM